MLKSRDACKVVHKACEMSSELTCLFLKKKRNPSSKSTYVQTYLNILVGEGICGMWMQILLLAFFPVAHIAIRVERNSHLGRCRQQGMKPCQQQMICASQMQRPVLRDQLILSGLHQLAPALLADYRQSKPRVTLNYYPGMFLQPKAALTPLQTWKTCNTSLCWNRFVTYPWLLQMHYWWATIKLQLLLLSLCA